ncbi:GNAT family N-acetyltransferase [Candidatus Poribacteria bacterium]|nr:GNAT family N-acetyltransferase [Candidatus Poribacteria bacterium]MYH80215.1 GNAT family N-acetyltransferase [Candidatus Poribacteria bacterium]MYK96115.1 GNAT family N-acetyltransferase [Candidatus Poribacteria bacterium]
MRSNMELMKIQLEVLFTQDENGCLQHINEPTGAAEPAPRFFFGYTNEGSICRFRHDLPDNVVTQLKEIAATKPMPMNSQQISSVHGQFKEILQRHAPIEQVWVGPAYRFPEQIALPTNVVRLSRTHAGLLKGDFAEMVSELNSLQPYLAVIEDSRAVSICRSVRSSSRSHEAGVDTLVGYRRRGYATSVVAAWARAVRVLNCIPLYSTSWDNVASQGVVQRLGLVQYGVDYHVT